jgi:predicted small metal-binding protein
LKRGFLIETNKEDEVINDIIKISHSIPNEDFDQIEKLKDRILNEILKSIFTLQKKKSD